MDLSKGQKDVVHLVGQLIVAIAVLASGIAVEQETIIVVLDSDNVIASISVGYRVIRRRQHHTL